MTIGYLLDSALSAPSVAARFVTTCTARFVTKVMPARFITNEVVTNRAGIVPFFSLGYLYM